MDVSPIGRAALEGREGTRLTAYKDSVGVWTIGTGITTASGLIKVVPGLTITPVQSDALFAAALEKTTARIAKHQTPDGWFADMGITPAPALEVDFNAEELVPSVLAHLTSGPARPTALFCSNDLLAMVVIRGLRRARVNVPLDMSILGFDGLAVGELLSPPLASIGSPNREIGCAAWDRLIERIEGRRANATPAQNQSLSQILPHERIELVHAVKRPRRERERSQPLQQHPRAVRS